MEESMAEKTASKVPSHLRQFHHRSKSCTNISTTGQTCYPFAPPKPADPVELCPPHWRLPEKHRLKYKLRAILLKDWQSLRSHPQKRRSPQRPTMMRMKDSDDYITARAANPRTGIISPSVGSPSPYGPPTPESPAEALKLRTKRSLPSSPTPDVKARPTLRRANEGRKISGGGTLRAHGNGWLKDGTAAVASPRVSKAEVGAKLVPPKMHDGDQFVVKMPSAREPQPYAFPGYSAKQIEAFAHYKEKARKVSGEGYDQRILAARQPSGGVACSGVSDDQDLVYRHAHSGRPFTGEGAPVPNRDITVLKRRVRPEHAEREMTCTSGAELKASSYAPFSSPRTPALRSGKTTATSLTTFGHLQDHNKILLHKPIPRKPIRISEQDTADLRTLPQVHLVHPTAASVPQAHRLPEQRQCSLGCVKDSALNVCVASDAVTPSKHRTPLFDGSTERHQASQGDSQAVLDLSHALSDLLLSGLVTLFELCKQARMPQVSVPVLEVLRAEHTTSQQKVAAMKKILFSTGQALGLITAVVMMWNLGSMVLQMLEVLFWPLTVPVRVLRWVIGV